MVDRSNKVEREREIRWISWNSSPSVVDRTLKDLTTISNDLFNNMHMKPYAFSLGANNSSRSKCFGYCLKEWSLKQVFCWT